MTISEKAKTEIMLMIQSASIVWVCLLFLIRDVSFYGMTFAQSFYSYWFVYLVMMTAGILFLLALIHLARGSKDK